MDEQDKITPMMKQYLQAKSEIPADAILMFRLGDFYEMFFDDASRAAPVLDVVLTRRAGYPMCGVPYHAINAYLPKLLDAGLKVAVAEQMEDPRFAKGIVKRAITRIITPGTIIDGDFLQPGVSNFLCAVCVGGKDTNGLSHLDISTGEFKTCELPTRADLESELQKLQPRECILPQALYDKWTADKDFPKIAKTIFWTPVEDWIFNSDNATELLKRHFHVLSLDGFGLRDRPVAVRAAGAILHYASENLRHNVGHIRSVQYEESGNTLGLDPICQRNLELVEALHGGGKDGTLLQILDKTSTAMGSRLMRNWILRPLCDREKIIARQDIVGLFQGDQFTLAEIRESLHVIRDLERLTGKLNAGTFNGRDMMALGYSLDSLPGLLTILNSYDLPLLMELRGRISELPELADRIRSAISDDPPASLTDGGIIRNGYNAELDELRDAATHGKQWVAELQAKEQERTNIKSLKVSYNRVFGYYIEVTKTNLANVPADYVRKQTLANGERFITPELKEMESKILGAEEHSKALENQLFSELKEYAQSFTGQILETAKAIAELDVLCALAECAAKYHYCRPHITDNGILKITGGRHPVIEPTMEAERFVPNDTYLDGDENRMMIITGPNMAGKSTYIRQTALLVIMAQIGSFIPADEATIGIADRIFTRVGAMDDLSRGQSTFMVEMLETANILNHATQKSIVILDEIGRGTSTFDGLSIAWSVAEFLLDGPGCRAQFATHYHELTELARTRVGVKNYNVAVREYGDQIVFLRQIVPGAADKSYGIHVAKLAGLPEKVISRARAILDHLESQQIDTSEMQTEPTETQAQEPAGADYASDGTGQQSPGPKLKKRIRKIDVMTLDLGLFDDPPTE